MWIVWCLICHRNLCTLGSFRCLTCIDEGKTL